MVQLGRQRVACAIAIVALVSFAVLSWTTKTDAINTVESVEASETMRENRDVQGKTITNTIGVTFVYVPAGTFRMGSPAGENGRQNDELQHEVQITAGFYLGTTEVTVGQFRKFVAETSYRTEPEKDGKGGWGFNVPDKFEGPMPRYTWQSAGWDLPDEHPVLNVTWSDAKSFCAWLSRKEGKTYRLPTEAEWEYACRAKTKTAYSSGDDPETLALVANVADGTLLLKFPDRTIPTIRAKDGYVFTAPVGKFRSNDFGLFDMHGNVWEWCEDWYAADYYKASPRRNPTGPATGSNRVFRGGSWYSPPESCRAAARFWNEPSLRRFYLGFRVLRVL